MKLLGKNYQYTDDSFNSLGIIFQAEIWASGEKKGLPESKQIKSESKHDKDAVNQAKNLSLACFE